jgi:hypothetical protein
LEGRSPVVSPIWVADTPGGDRDGVLRGALGATRPQA